MQTLGKNAVLDIIITLENGSESYLRPSFSALYFPRRRLKCFQY